MRSGVLQSGRYDVSFTVRVQPGGDVYGLSGVALAVCGYFDSCIH